VTVENVLHADLPGIMNIEHAEAELKREREAYVAHFVKKKQSKRTVQNRINKHVSRWRTFFYLETAEDYHILACQIHDMRKGRAKRREGRPIRPEDRSKRRTSQRLANRRRSPNTEEEDTLFDSAIDFEFDQLDNAPPSEEDVIISTETTTNHSSGTSSGDEFAHSLSNEIDRTPDSISSNLFDLCNSQTLSQYSNIPSLVDETWCQFDDMNDPASVSGMLHSGTNVAGDDWIGSLQQDICDGNSMDFQWQGDLASVNVPHVLSGNGGNWSGSNVFVPASHRTVVQPVIHDPIKSASGGGVETQSSGVPLPAEKVDNGMQQPKGFDQAQLDTLMAELKSQLQERRKQGIQKRLIPARRPPLAERDDLAPLIEQCLTTLRGPNTHMSGNKENRAGPEDRRPVKRYGAEVETTVEYLWNMLRAESCRIPSSVT
jgi:hypothetical protein